MSDRPSWYLELRELHTDKPTWLPASQKPGQNQRVVVFFSDGRACNGRFTASPDGIECSHGFSPWGEAVAWISEPELEIKTTKAEVVE